MRPDQRRIDYAGSVHDEEEIEAVVEVLRGGPSALRIGKNVQGVRAGRRRAASASAAASCATPARRRSTSRSSCSACEPGDEVITSAVTFSTDIAPMVRAGLVPAFVDVEPDTFNIDVDAHRGDDRPAHARRSSSRTSSATAPTGTASARSPTRTGCTVIEDSCDALGATLRGTPTGTRSDISVTSFALVAHHHRGRHRRDGAARRRRARRPLPAAAPLGPALRGAALRLEEGRQALLLRRSTASSTTTCSSSTRSAGTSSRPRSAPRSGWCSCASCRANLARRQRNFDLLSRVLRAAAPTCSCCRARLDGLDTGWHMFPVLIRPESGIRRAEFQQHMEAHGVDTRMVWTGNVTAPAGVREGAAPRARGRAARTPTG